MSHFRCEFDVVQRSRGGCARHMSAYQRRGRFTAANGKTADYSSRRDHVETIMLAPEGAPDWVRDPNEYWQRAALAERRWDAQEARIVQLTLPRGLSRAHWADIARKIGITFTKRGFVVQVDIHCTTASDGGENPHLHFLISMRALNAGRFAVRKDRYFNSLFHARAQALRAVFAKFLNAYCKRLGVLYHGDPRSNVDRGLPLAEPNLPRWNFSVYKLTGKKTPLLEQRDGERSLRKKIAELETECDDLERKISLLSELPDDAELNTSSPANVQAGIILSLCDKAGINQRILPPKTRLAARSENSGPDPLPPAATLGATVDADAICNEAAEGYFSWRP